jgi:hypothetical protein
MKRISHATVLKTAQKLIEDPGHWAKKAFGRNANGEKIDKLDDANQFCALGAIAANRVRGGQTTGNILVPEELMAAFDVGPLDFKELSVRNDKVNHLTLMIIYDFAILLAKDNRCFLEENSMGTRRIFPKDVRP